MLSKVILDSNVWIAYFVKADTTHAAAVKIIEDIQESDVMCTTELVISEVVSVLKLRYGQGAAVTFLEYITTTKDIEMIKSDVYFSQTVLLTMKIADTKLSFTDMSLLLLSTQYIIKTFDKVLQDKITLGNKE